jgi:hypothetical protein
MVPTLKIPSEGLNNNGFINGYIKDNEREVQYENSIYLLFLPKDIDKFRAFLDSEYERTKSVIDDYDYSDGFVVVVYKLNSVYKEDFELIKRGKYSKTSPDFQSLFPKMIKINENGISKEQVSIQYRVFNKSKDLVEFWQDKLGMVFDNEQEIWYAFNESEESLNIKEIKKHVEGETK